ncbi:hypothetical protein [Mollivirus kamchatka]|nr:hypothetical protein [Mollivirus kamchatka]
MAKQGRLANLSQMMADLADIAPVIFMNRITFSSTSLILAMCAFVCHPVLATTSLGLVLTGVCLLPRVQVETISQLKGLDATPQLPLLVLLAVAVSIISLCSIATGLLSWVGLTTGLASALGSQPALIVGLVLYLGMIFISAHGMSLKTVSHAQAALASLAVVKTGLAIVTPWSYLVPVTLGLDMLAACMATCGARNPVGHLAPTTTHLLRISPTGLWKQAGTEQQVMLAIKSVHAALYACTGLVLAASHPWAAGTCFVLACIDCLAGHTIKTCTDLEAHGHLAGSLHVLPSWLTSISGDAAPLATNSVAAQAASGLRRLRQIRGSSLMEQLNGSAVPETQVVESSKMD